MALAAFAAWGSEPPPRRACSSRDRAACKEARLGRAHGDALPRGWPFEAVARLLPQIERAAAQRLSSVLAKRRISRRQSLHLHSPPCELGTALVSRPVARLLTAASNASPTGPNERCAFSLAGRSDASLLRSCAAARTPRVPAIPASLAARRASPLAPASRAAVGLAVGMA
eukprot:scaffold224196_cov32-Tisochrysis_lutea.AAC.2